MSRGKTLTKMILGRETNLNKKEREAGRQTPAYGSRLTKSKVTQVANLVPLTQRVLYS